MALPANVATQITNLNEALNKLIADRERIISLFDDELGSSTYSLLSAGNKTAIKNALVSDMTAASNDIAAVVTALGSF